VRIRGILVLALAVGLLLGQGTVSPAQPVQVIKVSLVSFKFTPNLFTLHDGERVVLQLQNDDEKRAHGIASPYFSTVGLTVRGDAKQDVTRDGWKSVVLEPGRKAEVEFVAQGRGQWPFICPVFNHASQGQTGALVVWPAGYNPKS